ncbi:MAG: class I SAM-dependent methyltransferase [Novosphingobium sp.]
MTLDCAEHPGSPCQTVSLGRFLDESGKVGAVEVRQCRECGHGVTLPPLADVAFLYDGRESQDFQPDARGLAHRIKDIAFRGQAVALLRQLRVTPQRLLDFGCGSGQFTRVLSEKLGAGVVAGSDFHPQPPADLAAGEYHAMDRLAPLAGSFDVVLAMHVLEHDDDTLGLLERITAMAQPGGTVVLEVPNVECFWSKLLGARWDAWYVPFHRTHFSRKSLLRRIAQGGLELVALHDVTVPTMGRSMAKAFGAKPNLFWLLVGMVLHPLQWLGERLSGKPSALRVIARKP